VCACNGPPASEDAGGTDAGGVRDAGAACTPGELCGLFGTDDVRFVAGWWSPWREGAATGITGGFTSADVDACAIVMGGESLPPDSWSFGFFLFSNEADADGDGLPDPATYPVIPGWGGPHTEARGVEVGADSPGRREFGASGSTLVERIDDSALDARLDVILQDGGRIVGSVADLARCDPF